MGYEDLIIFDNFGDKMVSVKLADTKLLRDMAEYSMSKDKRIDYYDGQFIKILPFWTVTLNGYKNFGDLGR